MKRKTLTLTLVLLSCLALIGVGFASWIISPNKTETANGNFSVDIVEEKNLTTEAKWCDENGDIVEGKNSVIFGYKEFADGTTTNYNWLKNSNSEFQENLTLYLKVTVTDGKTAVDVDTSKVTVEVKEESGKYTTLATAQTDSDNEREAIVGALPNQKDGTIEIKDTLGTAGQATGVFYVIFTFSWGTAFAQQNPYQYYNAKPYDALTASQAKKLLGDLSTLNNCQFTATLVIPNN